MLLAFAGVTAVFLTFYNGWWGVDAMNVCRRLRAEDVAVDCHAIAHRGLLNVAADDVVEFNVRGSDATGQVMYFRKRNDYKAALVAYTIASVIGGTVHGSAAARILVETGHGSPTRAVKFAKRVVDEL